MYIYVRTCYFSWGYEVDTTAGRLSVLYVEHEIRTEKCSHTICTRNNQKLLVHYLAPMFVRTCTGLTKCT